MGTRKRSADDSVSDTADSAGEYKPLDPRGLIHVSVDGAKKRRLSHVSIWGPAHPRSSFEGYMPPLPRVEESQALADFSALLQQQAAHSDDQPPYHFVQLSNFSIYRPHGSNAKQRNRALEMSTLDKLKTRGGFDGLLFDGILSSESVQRYVEAVPFEVLTAEGYGDGDIVDLHGRVCLQSRAAQRYQIWYQLQDPAAEYRRFHEPFMWLATFTKHFVDHLLKHDDVKLRHFQKKFARSLFKRYDQHPTFEAWWSVCKLRDFRSTVAANVGYLWKECHSIDDDSCTLTRHPIWKECDPAQLAAIPQQRNDEKLTVVTPFVYDCFKHMYFAAQLDSRQVTAAAVRRKVAERKRALGLTPLDGQPSDDLGLLTPKSMSDGRRPSSQQASFDVGDVVTVQPGTCTKWKSNATAWYAYVQAIRSSQDGEVLDVIWLYEAADTTLGKAYYPFQNELFLSDNCSCGKDAVDVSCITGVVDVTWFARDPTTEPGLFVRQKFRTVHDEDSYDFVTLKQTDFSCNCGKHVPIFEECTSTYAVGDTVLVRCHNAELGEDVLEPAQIVRFNHETNRIVLRKLERQQLSTASARPNELVLTRELVDKPPSYIVRKCEVCLIDTQHVQSGRIPTPYDRDGAGDLFFVAVNGEKESGTGSIQVPLPDDEATPTDQIPPLPPAWNPAAVPIPPRLLGMGIFCGGGNLDRGLEDGGAVDFKYAVDWAGVALHSYKANQRSSTDTQYFLGSINDYIAKAIAGSTQRSIAEPGDFQVLTAGSPCPGFSNKNADKYSEESLRNASMVASVVSFADFYSPLYLILENVVTMTQCMGRNKDENVFSQILAGLVALGYQVQQFHMDAWSFGSSQSRSRVFIVASAPGLQPLEPPAHTHGHPVTKRLVKKALGSSSNGLKFGLRRDDFTPFVNVSASECVRDLPRGDAQPQLCPAFPDHRTPTEESTASRGRMAMVPISPHGMGIVQARNRGLLSGEPLRFVNNCHPARRCPKSRTYARLRPDCLFSTLLTALHIQDFAGGGSLHWEQHRSLTVMECRHGQGFPDHEVIVGTLSQAMKIVGNSVDRKVSLALGLSLRKSWLVNHQESRHDINGELPVWSQSSQSTERRSKGGTRDQTTSKKAALTSAQLDEVQIDGFKAIRRIIEAS